MMLAGISQGTGDKKFRPIAFTVLIILSLGLLLYHFIPPMYVGESGRAGGDYITGRSVSSVYVRGVFVNITCINILQESWNLISNPCIEGNDTLNYSLRSIMDSIISIHAHNSSRGLDAWQSYNPGIESFALQENFSYSTSRGYWINMNSSTNLTLIGNVSLPNFIALYQGWNLFGWTSNETRNITIALQGINGSFTSVHAYFANDSLDQWKVYNPSLDISLSDLRYMIPFYGYWINMTADANLKVI